MSHDDSPAARTIRAATEVFVPGPDDDPSPGAAGVEADRFVSHYLSSAESVAATLDTIAASVFAGRDFCELDLGERARVLDELASADSAESREIPELLGLLSVAAVYGEWTGQDADGRVVRSSLGWQMTGFDGPSRARSRLLRGR
ncbi:MAG: gluconate 2-dehydrogenase subunit 3 family protein [Actinomycetota bacterium]